MLPQLPRLPPSPIAPIRDAVKKGREQLEKARDDIRSIANELHIVEPPKETKPPKRTEESSSAVAEGTACNLCSQEHLHQATGDLAEAMRFAREGGLRHPEVVRRVTHALVELNEMERYDLSAAEIEKLSGSEREIAEWAVPKSRNIRHLINAAITSREVDDLQKAAAEAEVTATEFTGKVMDLPVAKECKPCSQMEDLKTFLERRRKGK